jgi:hypothetical protein
MTAWPTQSQADAFYGNPRGRGANASPAWEKRSLVQLRPPFRMTFAGKPITSIRIHRKCAPSLGAVLADIWQRSGQRQKLVDDWGASIFGGSYVYRLMRGRNALSMHAYGCAIDLDPVRNGLGDRTPHFSADHPVVLAFRQQGWVWGGDWDSDGRISDEGRPDGMHFQAARVA